ncbi:MAG TPA: hypothetical protein VGP13_03925 [Candidatus Paceibacterota bacterium]|jgi:hypothetical protein|nr:hypothetical protein [Candidatus Paceibacterota bacterium]
MSTQDRTLSAEYVAKIASDDLCDLLRAHHDLALKMAGRRVMKGIDADTARMATRNFWNEAVVKITEEHGVGAILAALNELRLPHRYM